MSFQLNVPPSMVAKIAKSEMVGEEGVGEEAGSEPTKKREDWKKLKELEEARKAGTAPAMKDEEGKDINPHIPQYIMQAPWYFGATQPTLRHQRPQDEKLPKFTDMNTWFKRGVKEGPVATKYRKGSCQNCGSMSHQKKDCLERPRKVGAKFTGQDIAPDEYFQPTLSFDYDGKRDRWNGYDPDEHKRIFDEYNKIEEAKRQLKSQRLETDTGITEDDIEEKQREDSENEEDEDKYADNVDMPGQKFESKQRITVRNLRIREDTAKYLYNLDPNSAYYDPKTRSMRENPYKNPSGKNDEEEVNYGGDNFVRYSGDALQMAKKQIFAWEAYEKGTDAHLQADPTKLEMLAREYHRKKEVYKDDVKQSILDKYGGEEHLEAPSKQLLLAQSEDYVEYSRHGTVIKGQEKAAVKSRYEEDVYINNHQSVWGSYWKEGRWGYKCCHSVIKESYCTGTAGQEAAASHVTPAITAGSSHQMSPPKVSGDQSQDIEVNESIIVTQISPETSKSSPPVEKEKKKSSKKKKKKEKKKKMKRRKKKKKHRKRESSSSSSSGSESDLSEIGEDEEILREKRIKEAMRREEERVLEVDRLMAMDERKRPYNSMFNVKEPTEDEMEAFRRKRVRSDDPMAQFLDSIGK